MLTALAIALAVVPFARVRADGRTADLWTRLDGSEVLAVVHAVRSMAQRDEHRSLDLIAAESVRITQSDSAITVEFSSGSLFHKSYSEPSSARKRLPSRTIDGAQAAALYLAYFNYRRDDRYAGALRYASVGYESSADHTLLMVGFESGPDPTPTPRYHTVTLGCDANPGFVVNLVTKRVTPAKKIC